MGGKIPFCLFVCFFSFFLPYLCRLTGSGLQNSANCSGIKVKLYKIYSTWLANPEDLPVRSLWHCASGYKVFPTLVPRGLSATGIPENEKTLGTRLSIPKPCKGIILIILDLLCNWEAVASQAGDFSPRFVGRGGTPVWEARISGVRGGTFSVKNGI